MNITIKGLRSCLFYIINYICSIDITKSRLSYEKEYYLIGSHLLVVLFECG